MLTRYPKLVAVWAHLGLSKELKHLHPTVHAFIIEKLLVKHNNLHADMSWDVLSKVRGSVNLDFRTIQGLNHPKRAQ